MLLFLASVFAAPEDQAPPASDPGPPPCITDAEPGKPEAEQKPGSEGEAVSGVAGGTLCPGAGGKAPHWVEAVVRTRPTVQRSEYPAGQTGDARCVVRIYVDTRGKVEDAVPTETCPAAFRESARRVALRYTFYPIKDEDRKPQKVSFYLAISFSQPD